MILLCVKNGHDLRGNIRVEQYVMAYSAEQDRIRAVLPEDCESLRPVLRINAEIRDGAEGDVELNTAVVVIGGDSRVRMHTV